jgi:hypothetical protein
VVNTERRNDEVIAQLRQVLHRGEMGLNHVPGLLKMVLKEGMWQHRIVPATGEVKDFTRFEEFVKEPPLLGLGADMGLIKRISSGDTELLDLLDENTANPHGGAIYRMKNEFNNVKLELEADAPVGNSKQQALRKLRKDRPDLHEQVIKGEKTPHAAMVEAGFRKRSITVPLDTEQAARTLLRNFTQEQLLEVIALLVTELQAGKES